MNVVWTIIPVGASEMDLKENPLVKHQVTVGQASRDKKQTNKQTKTGKPKPTHNCIKRTSFSTAG